MVYLGPRWGRAGVLFAVDPCPGPWFSPPRVTLTPSHPQRLLVPDLGSTPATFLNPASRLHLIQSWSGVLPDPSLRGGSAVGVPGTLGVPGLRGLGPAVFL